MLLKRRCFWYLLYQGLRLESWSQNGFGFYYSSSAFYFIPKSDFKELSHFSKAERRAGIQIISSACESRTINFLKSAYITLPVNTEQSFCLSSTRGHYCKQTSLICFVSLLPGAQWRTRAEKNLLPLWFY